MSGVVAMAVVGRVVVMASLMPARPFRRLDQFLFRVFWITRLGGSVVLMVRMVCVLVRVVRFRGVALTMSVGVVAMFVSQTRPS